MTAFCDIVYGPPKAVPRPQGDACARLMAQSRKCIEQIQGDHPGLMLVPLNSSTFCVEQFLT